MWFQFVRILSEGEKLSVQKNSYFCDKAHGIGAKKVRVFYSYA